jgi:hypothetical protein
MHLTTKRTKVWGADFLRSPGGWKPATPTCRTRIRVLDASKGLFDCTCVCSPRGLLVRLAYGAT